MSRKTLASLRSSRRAWKKARTSWTALSAALLLALVCACPAFAWEEYDQIIPSVSHGTINAQYLVVHSTDNPGATAQNHHDYWAREGSRAYAAHWVCDWTDGGTVIQVAYSNQKLWHVGNGNYCSVGLEICEGTTRGQFEKSFDTAAQWCAYFLNSKGWGIDRMVSHNEARTLWGGTTHTDPLPYFTKWGKSWADFEALVRHYMDGGTSESTDSTNTAVPQPSTSISTSTSTRYTTAELAAQVMAGKWGNNPSRSQKLTAAGYDATEVQNYVNSHYFGIGSSSQSSRYSVAQIASKVYRGEYGNNPQRKKKLESEGYNYSEIQNYVNTHYY